MVPPHRRGPRPLVLTLEEPLVEHASMDFLVPMLVQERLDVCQIQNGLRCQAALGTRTVYAPVDVWEGGTQHAC